MTNNKNLPRLDSSTTSKNTAVGWFQIVLGIISFVVALAIAILHGTLTALFSSGNSITIFTMITWFFIILGVWAISNGGNRMTVNSTYLRLQSYLKGGDFKLSKLSEMLGLTPEKLLEKINLMSQRNYWRNVTLLENAIVIEDGPNERVHKIFADEGMQFINKKEGKPLPHSVVLAILIALVRVLPLPFYKWMWVIVAIFASVPIKRLSNRFTPKRDTFYYREKPHFVAQKVAFDLTGDQQADALIEQGEKHLKELSELENSITDQHLNQRIREISAGTKQMLKELQNSPEKYNQVRQTMNYSLPTAIELFYKYKELDAQPIKGSNIQRSMKKIHEMSDLVVSTFERELNAMYQDQTLDIEVDIEVMRNLLQDEAMDIPTLTEILAEDLKEIDSKEENKL